MNRIPYTYMRERITRAGKFCKNDRQDWGAGPPKVAKSGQVKNSFPVFPIFYAQSTSQTRKRLERSPDKWKLVFKNIMVAQRVEIVTRFWSERNLIVIGGNSGRVGNFGRLPIHGDEAGGLLDPA